MFLFLGFLLLPFTAWQTVIPLAAWLAPLFLLRFVRTSTHKRVGLLLVFAAYAFGHLIAIRGLKWHGLFELAVWLILVPFCRALFYLLPYLADVRLGSRLSGWPRVLVFPLAFTTVDWLMSLNPAITTAGSPAYSQIDHLALMQLASITGIWGITFLIMWLASTVNELWEYHFDWRPIQWKLICCLSVLLAVELFGSVRLNFGASPRATVQAATVTLDASVVAAAAGPIDWANFNRSTEAQRAAARVAFQPAVDQMFTRIEMALREGAKIVGCQEAAGLVLEEDRNSVLDRASALAREYSADLQISLLVVTRSKTWPYLRNESILIDTAGCIAAIYDKTHPVKGGEAFVVIAGPGQLPEHGELLVRQRSGAQRDPGSSSASRNRQDRPTTAPVRRLSRLACLRPSPDAPVPH